MTQTIPAPIADYFAGSNAKDVAATAASFAQSASVFDEGKTHTGRPAIEAWIADAFAKYGAHAEVSAVEPKGGAYRVAALVSGNFPGSPATLHYDFTLADNQITALSIG